MTSSSSPRLLPRITKVLGIGAVSYPPPVPCSRLLYNASSGTQYHLRELLFHAALFSRTVSSWALIGCMIMHGGEARAEELERFCALHPPGSPADRRRRAGREVTEPSELHPLPLGSSRFLLSSCIFLFDLHSPRYSVLSVSDCTAASRTGNFNSRRPAGNGRQQRQAARASAVGTHRERSESLKTLVKIFDAPGGRYTDNSIGGPLWRLAWPHPRGSQKHRTQREPNRAVSGRSGRG